MIELVDMCSLQAPDRVDFARMKDSGVRGVWFKASQYSGSIDPTFDIGVERATKAGLLCGAYHFAFCGSDPIAQMQHFFKSAKGLGSHSGELPAMLDWEFSKNDNSGNPIPLSASVRWAEAAMAELVNLFGRGILYSFPYFLRERMVALQGSPLGNYDLNIAGYNGLNAPPPSLVGLPWKLSRVHQYVGNGGVVPGVPTDCDRDRFMGTEEEFQEFIGNDAQCGAV